MPIGSFKNDVMSGIELLNLTGVISIKFNMKLVVTRFKGYV